MENPIKKFIDGYIERRVNLSAGPGKMPPIPVEDPLKTNPLQPKAIIMDWFKTYQSLLRKELDDWQTARETRRHPWNPYTYAIQQLYNDACLDNVLSDQMDKRILRVTNKNYLIKDVNDEIDMERTMFIRKKWFRQMVKYCLSSKFYGYSLVYINRWEKGEIKSIKNMPREHVIPERGILLKNYTNYFDGLAYGDFPNFLIYMQLDENAFGLLERVAPLTILKRHSWASWDEFEQIFGIPLRIAKSANMSQKHIDELAGWMEQMGSAAFAVLQKTDDIEIHDNHQPDAFQVFNEKRKAVNEEISIGINGQTMTTFQGSSRSQSETHSKTQDEVTDEDIRDIEDWFNTDFINVMRNLGYDFPDGHYLDIVANTQMSIDERSKTDESVTRMGFRLDPEYVEQTYNVVLDKENPRKEPSSPPVDPGDGKEKHLHFFA